MRTIIVQSLLLLGGLSSFTHASLYPLPLPPAPASDISTDRLTGEFTGDPKNSSRSTKRTVRDPDSSVEWDNLSKTLWKTNPVCPEASFYDAYKGAGGMFPPNMETLDGIAAYLEGHKMAIQISASPASEFWRCKTVSYDDGAGVDWCNHHPYLIQMDSALPLAQAARMAIQRCKKVTGSTFDWNGNHDLGLMWGQVYS